MAVAISAGDASLVMYPHAPCSRARVTMDGGVTLFREQLRSDRSGARSRLTATITVRHDETIGAVAPIAVVSMAGCRPTGAHAEHRAAGQERASALRPI